MTEFRKFEAYKETFYFKLHPECFLLKNEYENMMNKSR